MSLGTLAFNLTPLSAILDTAKSKVIGHLGSAACIQPGADKIHAIKNLPVPCSAKDVCSFMGLCSYFHRFVKNIAEVSRPLTDLLKKDIAFIWGHEQANIFYTLILLLTMPLICHLIHLHQLKFAQVPVAMA